MKKKILLLCGCFSLLALGCGGGNTGQSGGWNTLLNEYEVIIEKYEGDFRHAKGDSATFGPLVQRYTEDINTWRERWHSHSSQPTSDEQTKIQKRLFQLNLRAQKMFSPK